MPGVDLLIPPEGETKVHELDNCINTDQGEGDGGVTDGADADGHEEGVVEVDEVQGVRKCWILGSRIRGTKQLARHRIGKTNAKCVPVRHNCTCASF